MTYVPDVLKSKEQQIEILERELEGVVDLYNNTVSVAIGRGNLTTEQPKEMCIARITAIAYEIELLTTK